MFLLQLKAALLVQAFSSSAVVSSPFMEEDPKVHMSCKQLTVEHKHDQSSLPFLTSLVLWDEIEGQSVVYSVWDGVPVHE